MEVKQLSDLSGNNYMETGTGQEISMVNEVHLCAGCCKEYPSCDPQNIIFGTGKGGDNVAACSIYEPVELRHPKHNGAGQI